MTQRQKDALTGWLRTFPAARFHHGDCVGADEQAHDIALEAGLLTVGHPPTVLRYRAFTDVQEIHTPRPYIERNHDIVDVASILFAAPVTAEERVRSGTWATVRYARKTNVQVIILAP